MRTLVPPADDFNAARRTICADRGHPVEAGCYQPWEDLTYCPCGERVEPENHVVLPIPCPSCWYGDGPCSRLTPCEEAS